jgi:7,8-dihydroneopterin aldolase/epimerase/oxygenase
MAKFEIRVEGLKVFAHHGVFEFEKALGQEFVLDAWLTVESGLNDKLDESVSYALVAEVLTGDAKANPVNLLETLAHRLHSRVMEISPRILHATITVHKPNAPIDLEFSDVSVSYSGGRD